MSGIAEGPASNAGWFPDPAGSANVRWWDGTNWTDHLIDPVTGAPPVAAAPPPPVVVHQPELPPATAATSSIAAAEITPSGQPLTRRELREQQAAAAGPAVAEQQVAEPRAAEPQAAEPRAAAPVAPTLAQEPIVAPPAVQAPVPPPVVQAPVAPPVVQAPVETPAAPAQPLSSFDLLMSPHSSATPVAEQQSPFQESTPTSAPTTAFPAAAYPATAFPATVPSPDQPWAAAPAPQVADLFPVRDEPVNQAFFTPATPAAPVETAEEASGGSASTFAIWLFAALPILHFALIWYVYQQLTPTDGSSIRWVVIAGPIVVYLIVAMLDRSRLVANGHESVPSPLFAIIPPIYLAFRVTRVGLAALPPAIVWLVLQAGTIAVLVLAFPGIVTHLTT